ncbi:hypothetical protein MTR67_022945 [Solanum verrucosum]
MQARL